MSTNKKWDDASEKDLLFAMLMSTGDGSANIKADWQKVSEIMTSWGYAFTICAMSQHWSKTIQKAFKERHPDNAKDGGKPAPPSKADGTGSRKSKTPASTKGAGKARRRAAPHGDTSPESGGAFNPTPIAKEKTPRASAKKMKYSEQTDVDDEEEEEHVMIKGETKTDEDYNHAA